MPDVNQDEIEVKERLVASLRQPPRRALFVSELSVTLGSVASEEVEEALTSLAAEKAILVRDHYCADPHLEGVDLRVAALVEAPDGEDPQWLAISAIERTWTEWIAEYLANHRCS